MSLVNKVKPRLGIFYSEPLKNEEIESMVDGALGYFKGAGWVISKEKPSSIGVEAVILFCKMAQSTDPSQLTNHPVLISYVSQGRNEKNEIQP